MNQFFHWIQIRREKRIKIIMNQNGCLIKKNIIDTTCILLFHRTEMVHIKRDTGFLFSQVNN